MRSTAEPAPGWCPSAGGRCRSSTRGTIDEHLACRRDVVDVRRVAPRHRARRGRRFLRRAPARVHERPVEDRAGSGPVHPSPRRRRRVGARRHHRVVAPVERGRSSVRRDAERIQHRPRARRDRGPRDHARPGRDRGPGPDRPNHRRVVLAGGGRGRSVPGRPVRRGRRPRASSPAPATPARTASRSRFRPMSPDRSGTLSSPPAPFPPGSVPATRFGSKPRCRCTVTSSVPASRRCKPGWAGWSRGTRATSRDATRSSPNASAASTAASSASRRRAVARRGPAIRSSSTARPPVR